METTGESPYVSVISKRNDVLRGTGTESAGQRGSRGRTQRASEVVIKDKEVCYPKGSKPVREGDVREIERVRVPK